MKIEKFVGEFYFLSNFSSAIIYIDGEKYTSAEHAYQAAKAQSPQSKQLIREAKTPGLAKKLGYSVQLPDDWDAKKVDIMTNIIRKKFENPFLRPLLLATGSAELIEGNTWGDRFWGVCKGTGQNHLGKILMEIRQEIQLEEAFETKNA